MLVTVFSYALVIMVMVQWIQTWRLHGGLSGRLLWLMVRYALRSARRTLFLASCCGLAATLVMIVAPGWLPPLPVPLSLALSLVGLTGAILPPAVLYLGASTPEGGRLVSELVQAIAPLRLVHLLDTTAAHAGPFLKNDLINSSNRTDSFPWRTFVSDFMEIVPVVVVDLRIPSPAVLDEAVSAVRDHGSKSLFLAVGSRLPGQLSALAPGSVQVFASPDALSNAVRARAWSSRVTQAVS